MDMIFLKHWGVHRGSIAPKNMESSIKMRVLFGFRIALEPDFLFSHNLSRYCRTILRAGF